MDINLLKDLRADALSRHQMKEPLSAEDTQKLSGDLIWRAAREIMRLGGVIARNCDPGTCRHADSATVEEAKSWARRKA